MILALRFSSEGQAQTMKLARLLADLEPKPRQDVLLAFTHKTMEVLDLRLFDDVFSHCSQKFQVTRAAVGTDPRGWPWGPNDMWIRTVDYFATEFKKGLRHDSIFVIDGNDGVPLYPRWIDLVKDEHARTLTLGRRVTGAASRLGTRGEHVNANMVVEFSFWHNHPELAVSVPEEGRCSRAHDVYHGKIFLKEASTSSLICNEWRSRGITREIMDERAARSAWLHGYKDENLCDVARQRLVDLPADASAPVIQHDPLFK
jgi:hypothetical protein